jgi:hypothetical protein
LVGAAALVPSTAPALTDFSAGKRPDQLFDSDCSGCHQSAQGLANGRPAAILAVFLREHYTTKAQSATLLASYLLGVGVVDPEQAGVSHHTVATFREQGVGNLPILSERKSRKGSAGEGQQLRKGVVINEPSNKAVPEAESRKPSRVNRSPVRAKENSFLKIVWRVWHEMAAFPWWLIGQVVKLFARS